MLRQILIYTAIAAILGLLSYYVYQLLKSESDNIDAVALLPEGMESVIALEKLSMWPARGEWAQTQMQSKTGAALAIWQQWYTWSELLFQQAENDPTWKSALEETNLVFGGTHTLSPEPWVLAFVVNGQNIGAEDWLKVLSTAPIQNRSYKGQTIYAAGDLFVCRLGAGIVTSTSVASIEGCILAQENKSALIHNTPFMQAYEVRSSDNPIHFFARYNAQEWMQLEPVTSDEGPAWIGVQIPSDSSAQTTLIHGKGPAQLTIPSWLPERTYYWDALHFEDRDELLRKCEQFYANSDRAAFWQTAWQAFGDSCACDLNEALIGWRNGQTGMVAWDVNDSVSGEIYYYGINDTLSVVQRMPQHLLRKLDLAAPIYQIQIPLLFDRNRINSIYVEPTYLMQLGSYLLLGQSLEDLQHLYAQSSMAQPPNFLRQASGALQNISRVTYIGDQSSLSTLPMAFHQLLLQGQEHLMTFDYAAAQSTLVSIYTKERLATMTGSIAPTVNAPDTTTVASAQRKWTVINHNTSERETLEECADHSLQLKDPGGKVLWTYKKSSPILGDVRQIDALKNGKLQYAFTTREGLWVIDRNGQNYAPLCRSTSIAVTSPLAVFDYESNKNYRLVYALENGEVLNLTAGGQPTEGWKYEKQGVIRALLHFKQGTDDCIVTIDAEGQLRLHKRNGTLRPEACTKITTPLPTIPEMVIGKDLKQTRIRWTGTDGQSNEQSLLTE